MPFYVALVHTVAQKPLTLDVCHALKASITQGGGLMRKLNNSGRRPLPTKMKAKMGLGKQKFANIISAEFVANPKCAVSTWHTIKAMDPVMRFTLLRADELLFARPPRPEATPKGCIQEWYPEGVEPDDAELLERRSKHESELIKVLKGYNNEYPEEVFYTPEDWERIQKNRKEDVIEWLYDPEELAEEEEKELPRLVPTWPRTLGMSFEDRDDALDNAELPDLKATKIGMGNVDDDDEYGVVDGEAVDDEDESDEEDVPDEPEEVEEDEPPRRKL